MQQVALRAQLARAQEEATRWRLLADRQANEWRVLVQIREAELREARQALSLARAGLLIALSQIEAPAARALVACALESSEIPG